MAIALVAGQTATGTGSGVSSITATLPSATTPGNVVVCWSGTFTTTRDGSLADSNAGDAASTECADSSAGSTPFSRIHVHAYLVTTGAAAQTFTYGGALSGAGYIAVAEFTGLAGGGLLVDAAVGTNVQTNTTFGSGTLTTTRADTLLCGAFMVSGALTPVADAGFTSLDRAADRYFGYRIVSATGGYAFTPTTGSSASGQTVLAAVAGTAAAGGSVPLYTQNLMRHGIL
jgi:hypothetical protein